MKKAPVPVTPVVPPKQPPPVLQPPANKIVANDLGASARSKSTPSVTSMRSTISGAGQNAQAIQRSKSQAAERPSQKLGSTASKSPVGYSYSAGPGFRSRRPLGHEGLWQGELPSHFAPGEIKRLGKRFRKLDMDNSGALSVEEFMSLPELQQNPCVQRVLEIFDADGNGEIDFKEFIHGISQFSVKGDKESKLRFAFRLYDMDKDGYISNGELFQVLKMMVGNNLKDSKLQQIVDKTILYADKDADGKISFREFCAVVGSSDVHKKMIVQV